MSSREARTKQGIQASSPILLPLLPSRRRCRGGASHLITLNLQWLIAQHPGLISPQLMRLAHGGAMFHSPCALVLCGCCEDKVTLSKESDFDPSCAGQFYDLAFLYLNNSGWILTVQRKKEGNKLNLLVVTCYSSTSSPLPHNEAGFLPWRIFKSTCVLCAQKIDVKIHWTWAVTSHFPADLHFNVLVLTWLYKSQFHYFVVMTFLFQYESQ